MARISFSGQTAGQSFQPEVNSARPIINDHRSQVKTLKSPSHRRGKRLPPAARWIRSARLLYSHAISGIQVISRLKASWHYYTRLVTEISTHMPSHLPAQWWQHLVSKAGANPRWVRRICHSYPRRSRMPAASAGAEESRRQAGAGHPGSHPVMVMLTASPTIRCLRVRLSLAQGREQGPTGYGSQHPLATPDPTMRKMIRHDEF